MSDSLAALSHNNRRGFVGVATEPSNERLAQQEHTAPLAHGERGNGGEGDGQDCIKSVTLPRYARLPINHCNLPAAILGSLSFQHAPVQLTLGSVAELNRGLFTLLDKLDTAKERARAFTLHSRS